MKAHEVLSEFTRLVQPAASVAPSPQDLCHASVAIAGATGGAVIVDYADPTRMTLFATDHRAYRLEDLQEVLGEGPGWEAHRTSEATSADLGATTRWPLFSVTAVQEIGAVKVAAAPIHAGGAAVGVLSLYWATPQPAHSWALGGGPRVAPPGHGEHHGSGLDPLDLLGLLGNLVGAFFAVNSEKDWETYLPWSHRASIHQATGILVAQLRLSVQDAVAVLRAYAFSSGLDLQSAATSVVQQRVTLQLPEWRTGLM